MKFDAFLRRQLRHAITPDARLYFPYGRRAFVRMILMWQEQVYRTNRIDDERLPRVTAILQSYARPWNIDPMARLLLRFTCIDRLIISNNNPAVNLSRFLTISDERIAVITQPEKRPASMMAMLAFRTAEGKGAVNFLSIDDDLFLFPAQILRMLYGLGSNPSAPVGLVGQRIDRATGAITHHVTGAGRVNVLNRAYAFTDKHIHRYMQLLDALGYTSDHAKETLPFGSDIVLSFSGEGQPRLQDAGVLLSCPTAALPGIARFKEPGFDAFRTDLLPRVRKLSRKSA